MRIPLPDFITTRVDADTLSANILIDYEDINVKFDDAKYRFIFTTDISNAPYAPDV